MELGLKGKNVVVTGGGTNIGRAIVLAFAAEGSNIAIAELNRAAGDQVAAEVQAMGTGASATVVDADVTNKDNTDAMIADAIGRLGSVDVLVNNVGWTVDRLFMEKPRAEHIKEVDVNLWGAINCIHSVLPHMIERESGSIVSISSDAGRMGEYREAVYSACKAGVIALSKALARETGRYGLRLNMVCPGLVVPPQAEVTSSESMWSQGYAGYLHRGCPGARAARLPVAAHGHCTGGGQRRGLPGIGRGQFHHRTDLECVRRLYDDVTRAGQNEQSSEVEQRTWGRQICRPHCVTGMSVDGYLWLLVPTKAQAFSSMVGRIACTRLLSTPEATVG